MDIERIREDFPALQHFIWFQNGGLSITPRPVAEEHAQRMKEILERGPMHVVHPDEEYPRRQRSMETIARFLSVEPAELALMRGVSEGFQTVIRGMSWNEGDEIVLTADEEAALLMPAIHLRERFGVKVVRMPLLDDRDAQIEAFRHCLTDRTKLVALSHVATDLGHRIPASEICDIARERGILSFLDLAHSAGLYRMSLRDLGCDFAGVLSYKWMYAPYASAALFVRRERLNDIEVTYAGGRSQKSLDFENEVFEMHDTAQRFEYGPFSWPLNHAWARSLEYLEEIGMDNIWNRTVSIANRLKEGLNSVDGATLHTPVSPDLSAALVTFSLKGWRGEDLVKALRDRWNIFIKNPEPQGMECLRTSIAFFLLEEEIDKLIGALQTLSQES